MDHASLPDYFDVGMDRRGGLDVEPGGEDDTHVGKILGFMGMIFSKARSAPKEVTELDPGLKAFQEFLSDETQHYS